MNIVKAKFSRKAEFEFEYMKDQKEYSFKSKELPAVGDVLFGRKYKKFMHVTGVLEEMEADYYSAEKNAFADGKADDTYFKLGTIVFTEEKHNDVTLVDVI